MTSRMIFTMRPISSHSPSDTSHSLTFLGEKSSSPLFKNYRELIEECSKCGEFISFDSGNDYLCCYKGDAQPLYSRLPILVFRPHTCSDIAPFIRVCHRRNIPVTVRGGGTGFSGGSVPSKEGVVLLTGHLKGISEYDSKEGRVTLEPGVTPRQLNEYVGGDGWHFPLSLPSGGVAGIAGCLGCNSKGYFQQQEPIYDSIIQVKVIDGTGEMVQAAPPLVCGAEGLLGVIVSIELQLNKYPARRALFSYGGSWESVLENLPTLLSLELLKYAVWFNDKFYFQLEGDLWRFQPSISFLAKTLPSIRQESCLIDEISRNFYATNRFSARVGGVFRPDQLPYASAWVDEQAAEVELESSQMVDLVAGSLQILIQSKEDEYSFKTKMERFLVLWADFTIRHQGTLSATHGIGVHLRHYTPPFWSEESQLHWRNLKASFDPKNLFGRDRYFPVVGRSLEKVGEGR